MPAKKPAKKTTTKLDKKSDDFTRYAWDLIGGNASDGLFKFRSTAEDVFNTTGLMKSVEECISDINSADLYDDNDAIVIYELKAVKVFRRKEQPKPSKTLDLFKECKPGEI